jgi:DNA repair protein RadC
MPKRAVAQDPKVAALQEAISAYVSLPALREAVARGGDLRRALITGEQCEAAGLVAVLEALVSSPEQQPKIRKPADILAPLTVRMASLDHEELIVICLDTKNRVLCAEVLYRGSLNAVAVRVGEVFKSAIRLNAAALILAHNHPSGEPDPSDEDIVFTRKAVEAASLLDLELLDHLIIGRGRSISMREKGLGFSLL